MSPVVLTKLMRLMCNLQRTRNSLECETYGNKYVGFVQHGVKTTGFDHFENLGVNGIY